MIINNNTTDLSYLGAYSMEHISFAIGNKVLASPYNFPQSWDMYGKNDTLLFDCNGCRYGFRIKQLKTK